MASRMDLPFPELSGDMLVETYDSTDPDADPNYSLEIDREWYIQPHWWVTGPGAIDLGGNWHVIVRVEGIAELPEVTLMTVDIPITDLMPAPRTYPLEYKPLITIPSKLTDPDHAINEEGVYMLVVELTYTNEFGSYGRARGFVEGPLLQFYHFEDR